MKFYRFLFNAVALLITQCTLCDADTQSDAKFDQCTQVSGSNFDVKLEKNKCTENRCSEKSTNGKCDEECNNYTCNFDGFECSLVINLWKNCSKPVECSKAFIDGKCDEACNNSQCLFDGRDCEKKFAPCPSIFETYCRKHYANGICDYGCKTPGCGWDGLDCDWSEPDIAEGVFSLVNTHGRTKFPEKRRWFSTRNWSSVANICAREDKDELGKDMIFPWGSDNNNRTKPIAVLIHLEIDNRKCNTTPGTVCFATASEAALYLAAVATKKSLSDNFPIGN